MKDSLEGEGVTNEKDNTHEWAGSNRTGQVECGHFTFSIKGYSEDDREELIQRADLLRDHLAAKFENHPPYEHKFTELSDRIVYEFTCRMPHERMDSYAGDCLLFDYGFWLEVWFTSEPVIMDEDE